MPEFFARAESYTVFSPAEAEGESLCQRIVETVEQHHPTRVFVDSMTQFRFLLASASHFRKQGLSFLRFLNSRGATVLVASETSPKLSDDDLQFLADGVIELRATSKGRTVAVKKFRGSHFLAGLHELRLGSRGMQVFPRLTLDSTGLSANVRPC